MHLQHCKIDSLARFHRPLLFFYFTCPAASCSGEAPEWTKHQRLFVHQCQTIHFHSSLSLSVYLLHSPSMSMSLFPVSIFQQCFTSEPQPTQQIPLRGTSPFYLAHSLSRTPARFCLTPRLHLSLPHQRNLRLSLRIGDPTQHPRGSDFIRRQLLQSRPQEQSVGGEANYLRHRVWDTSVRPLEDITHLGVSSHHLIFPNVHLWISFVSTISCRNVHLCCLGNEAVVLFKAAIDKATKVLTNWLCFPQPLFQHTS